MLLDSVLNGGVNLTIDGMIVQGKLQSMSYKYDSTGSG